MKNKTMYWILTVAISSFMFFSAYYSGTHIIEFKQFGFFLASHIKIYSQTPVSKTEAKMETIQAKKSDTLEQILIDKLIVPEKAKQEFIERLNINRNFIKQLPGFVNDIVYERSDGQ